MNDTDFRKRLSMTQYVVEASSFEQHALWQNYHYYPVKFKNWHYGIYLEEWEQDNPGCIETIGRIDGRPICLAIFWNIICGMYVMFYEVCSELADHKMKDEWFIKNCNPKDSEGRPAHCDANNFQHCALEIKRKLDAVKL